MFEVSGAFFGTQGISLHRGGVYLALCLAKSCRRWCRSFCGYCLLEFVSSAFAGAEHRLLGEALSVSHPNKLEVFSMDIVLVKKEISSSSNRQNALETMMSRSYSLFRASTSS